MMIYFVYSLQGAFIKMPKFETLPIPRVDYRIIPSIGNAKTKKLSGLIFDSKY